MSRLYKAEMARGPLVLRADGRRDMSRLYKAVAAARMARGLIVVRADERRDMSRLYKA